MKIEKLAEKNLNREYSITVPANDIEKKTNLKLIDLSKKISLPGFRKGKVPMDLVKKKHQTDVMGEVINEIINEFSDEAIKTNNLKPVTQPKVEITDFAEGKDLVFKLSIEVFPEVPEVKLEKIKLKKLTAEISDAEVNKLLEEVSKNQKNFQVVTEARAAKLGDAVLIDFKGFLDGVAFPGGEGKGFRLELGGNAFIPGFEDQLVGSKKGDAKKVKVTFPKEYHSKDLAGKATEFEVTVHDVLEAGAVKIDDDFAKQLGAESLDALKASVKSNLALDGQDMGRILLKKDLFDKLEETVKFDLPETMVEAELNSIIHQVKNSNEHNHVHDENCDHNKEDAELKKEYASLAKRRVMLGILVTDIASKNKIEVSNEDLNRALLNEASRYPGQEQQVVEFYRKNPQAIQNLKGPIIEEKVVDFILTKTSVSEEPTSLEKLRDLVLESNK